MAEPFLGEIRLFAFNRVPTGWVPCNGQLMSIAQNQALFSLLGTTYGGNGSTNFALPNLQSRIPIGFGNGPETGMVALGQFAGEESHTLQLAEIPAHTHLISASTATATEVSPQGAVWAQTSINPYAKTPNGLMNQSAVSIVGSTQGHPNMQPYNVVQYCIAIQGIYPSRN